MGYRGIVTLQGLDKESIHRQIEQLKHLQRSVIDDDSLEAVTLAETLRLLGDIERALVDQERVMH